MIYDVVIIGGGAAGLSAALYAGRAKLNTIVLEKDEISGGQIVYSNQVDNYLGIPQISGFDIMEKFKNHTNQQKIEFYENEVKAISKIENIINIELCDGTVIKSYSAVLATGAEHNKLGIPGEKEYSGRGVSYCAVCDGAFYKDREVAVIGGGDSALEETLYLSNICSKIYLIHRRNELRGNKSYQERIKAKNNIEFIGNTAVDNIIGEKKVSGIECHDVITGKSSKIIVQGVFLAIGMKPVTYMVSNLLDTDELGYIKAGEDGITNIPGIFVAGDMRTKMLRQLITAVSDGANCIYSVEKYLADMVRLG